MTPERTAASRLTRSPVAAFLAACLALAACGTGGPSTTAAGGSAAAPQAMPVVAAENFYGDVAAQIGGSHVAVTSILSDPNVDPHLYESNVDSAKAVATARLVIVNGVGYDAFMDRLLAASPQRNRSVINVGKLIGAPADANPHLWYDPQTMPKVAQALADNLSKLQPASKADFEAGLQTFNTSLKPLQDQIATVKARHAGAKVLPTEPVFDYMAAALGLEVVDKDGKFQKAVEQGNDPPADAVARFRQQLTSRTIKALIYNSQAVTPMTTQLQTLAQQNQVSVVGVSETQPPGKTFQQWQLDQLQALQKALEG